MENLVLTSKQLRSLPLHELDELLNSYSDINKYLFESSTYSDVDAFFDEAYSDYDTGCCNPYWRFSDDILKQLTLGEIIENFRFNFQRLKILDAGAGTGNWSRFLKDQLPSSEIVLFDRNIRMLSKAHEKFSVAERGQVRFIEGNLEESYLSINETFDVIICFHNVIGLARKTELVLVQLSKLLRQGGIALIMAPNYYHSLIFL